MALHLLSLYLVVLVSLCPSGLAEPPCPYTWSRPAHNSSDNCTCGDDVQGRVRCNNDPREVEILLSYCMTYDNTSHETVLGSCPFFPTDNSTNGYIALPTDVEELNHAVCHHANRKGRLCGECRSGYAPGALSYDHDCVECDINFIGRWIIFVTYQFIPVTVFFFIVLVFRLEVISGPLTAFVFFAQVYSIPENIRLIELLGRQASGIDTNTFLNFHKILITIYGVWNLDFGRAYLVDICLGERVTTIEAVAMEFIEPFYLILLTVLTFTVVALHGRGFKPVVVVWRPLTACFTKFKEEWKIRDSLIHTIATFLLLSYTKVVVVSIRILNGTVIYNVNGDGVALVPYFSTQDSYFHGEHAAYAMLAILTLSTLVAIPPIVLLLYPFRKCHVCMGVFCRPRLQNGLRTFVESFQGSYKDGTSNRYDFRYTAGWYFLLRIIVAVGGIDNVFSPHFGQQAIALVLFLTAVGFALLQPYKKHLLNVVDTFHFVTLSLIYWLLLNDVYLTVLNRGNSVLGLIAFLSILPCVYRVSVTIYWVYYVKKFPQRAYRWLKNRCIKQQQSDSPSKVQEPNSQTPLCRPTAEDLEASFADRLANPATYDVLIPSRQKAYSHLKQTSSMSEETQTSGEFSSLRYSNFVTTHMEGDCVELPRKPPTSSVVQLEDSWQEVEGDRESLGVQMLEGEV